MQTLIPIARRIVLGALLNVVVLVPTFIALNYFRMIQLDGSHFYHCDPASPALRSCVDMATYRFLAEPHWLAVQFTVYIVLSLVCGAGLARKPVLSPLLDMGLVSAVAAAALLTFLQPGRLPAVAVVGGCLLGGLIVKSRAAR